MEGKLHIYHEKRGLILFEYVLPDSKKNATSSTTITTATTAPGNSVQTTDNVLLFIGGMYDNFGRPGYVSDLAALFPRHEGQKWTVMHVQLTSAMSQFGISDLDRDVEEVGAAIRFIRHSLRGGQPTNVVIMGHSTGCQDTLHYLHSEDNVADNSDNDGDGSARPRVQGAILQAAISDRDMLKHMVDTDADIKTGYDKCVQMASETTDEQERTTTILPLHWTSNLFGPAPMSISRFLSLMSTGSPANPSREDKFSHDLGPEALSQTFGKIGSNGILSEPEVFFESKTVVSLPVGSLAGDSISKDSTTEAAAETKGEENLQRNEQSKDRIKDKDEQSPKQRQILILLSANDEYYPPGLADKLSDFLSSWSQALSTSCFSPDEETKEEVKFHKSTQALPHAKHDISGTSTDQKWARLVGLRSAVLTYLSDVVGGVDGRSWSVVERDRDLLLLETDERS